MMQPDKILVVDDNEAGRYVKARVLERAGYTVLQAGTGHKALEIASGARPALVVLDVSLPDIGGFEVCREIKKREPGMLVLQTSAAFTGKQDRAAGLIGGADSYLTEPLEPEELCATVEALLRLRHAEQELRSSHASLERQVDAHSHELEDAAAKLRAEVEQREEAENILRHAQRMDTLGQLTGSIAHDFNNLLAIILGNLEMLRRRLGANPDPKIATNVDNAFFGARRAANLTRQLLAFSRRQPLQPRPTVLEHLLTTLVGLLRQSTGESISVTTSIPKDLWPVYVDQGELEAALLNLAMNARDAMPQGGELSITLANAPGAGPQGQDWVAVAIKDTGHGMSDKVLKYAFEPFFTTKQVGEGTGLGLAQVYGFATQAGGDVRIKSEMGLGTTVTLSLPRHAGPMDEAATPETATPGAITRAVTILVVEDNMHVRAQTTDMLKELGYKVEEAGDAAAALAALSKNETIELLFTDIGLPGGMDGTVLAERALVIRPKLKVLLTSGYALTTPSLKRTQFPILSKPFTFASLASALRGLHGVHDKRAVVLVEDESLIRMDTAELLSDEGFIVEEATNAAQAVALMSRMKENVGAIIIDLGLPDRRGDDLATELRATYPGLAIVIASGDAGMTRQTFANDSLIAFADKPYRVDHMASLLRKLCPAL